MPYRSLRDFMEMLEASGRLKRVTEPVSTRLEMTEIQTRLLAEQGPAVLFENPVDSAGQPYDMPVLVNLFGTVDRVAAGMDRSPAELRGVGETLAFLRQPTPPANLREALSLLPTFKSVLAMKPKTVKRAPCQEVVLTGEDIDLTKLPIMDCWPGEPAPLITWPLVVTQGPGGERTDDFNLGIYRMQRLSKNRTIMRWLKHRGGAQHYQRWKQNKPEPMPCAVVLGADPGTILAAVTPVPDTLSEYQFAGLLRGKKVELVDCKTIPLKVPAEAEIILEGHVLLDDYADEGPYGDHTGYYNSVEPFPVFEITAITMRQKPIYLSTFTGRPPDEPSVLGEGLNDVFVPLIQQQFPELEDFWLPPEGCSYRVAVVSLKKAYPGHAKRVMMGVWSYLRQFMYTKFVIVVDAGVDCRDWAAVSRAMAENMIMGRDITTVEGTPIDYLDFASPESGLGGKVAFDATTKWAPELAPPTLDVEVEHHGMLAALALEVVLRVERLAALHFVEHCAGRLAFAVMEKNAAGQGPELAKALWQTLGEDKPLADLLVLCDPDIDPRNWDDVIWAISTRMDPVRDLVRGPNDKLCLDATDKLPPETHREWGEKIQMDQDVIAKVDKLWPQLGLPGSGKAIW